MDNVNYFTDIIESISVYKNFILLMFVIRNDVNFL